MALINGTNLADTLNGTTGNDEIRGGNGSDTITGGAGNDIIFGQGVDDRLPEAGEVQATLVASGFAGPIFVTSAPGDATGLYVGEKDTGTIWRLDLETNQKTLFLKIPAADMKTGEDRGLLGFTFAPDYATSGKMYVNFTDAAGDQQIREYTRSSADPSVADPASARDIINIDIPDHTNHRGGFIGFSPTDGKLYIAVGDGDWGDDFSFVSQDKGSLLGKILRIDVGGDDFPGDAERNYAVPDDNPFADGGGAPEIWAIGVRNPWRISFDSQTGDLYVADVGSKLREEITLIRAGQGGANLGWPYMQGSEQYNPIPDGAGPFLEPIYSYDRSVGGSVIGGYVYHGPAPGLQGAYIFADFVSNRFMALRDGVVTDITDQITVGSGAAPRLISSFGTGPDNELYVISLTGSIFRLDATAGADDSGDVLLGGDGDDQIFGGGGADLIQGGSGNDLLRGGAGNDILYGEAGNDELHGDDGNDILVALSGDDLLDGGADNDVVIGATGADILLGGAGNDQLYGYGGNDRLEGGAGNDLLVGDIGDDTLLGDDGNDILHGYEGNDALFGGSGDDILVGHEGDDALHGEAGNDLLIGHAGNDALDGGTGDDLLYGYEGADIMDGADGNDFLAGGTGDDVLRGGTGNDQLIGEAGADILEGGDGDDALFGTTGDDRLTGGAGNDALFGDSDRDTLDGGVGNDHLIGGSGIDTFVFKAGSGNDLVVDFDAGIGEKIDLSAYGLDNLDAVKNVSTSIPGGVVIQLDANNSVLLWGVALDDLKQDNFIFG